MVVQCTGSRPGSRPYDVDPGAHRDRHRRPAARARRTAGRRRRRRASTRSADRSRSPSPRSWVTRAILVTQDHIAGNELSRSGDLAPANVRLAQARVRIERRTLLRAVRAGSVDVEDRFSGRAPLDRVRRGGRLRLPAPRRADREAPIIGRATAWRRAPCTRRSSKDAASPSRSEHPHPRSCDLSAPDEATGRLKQTERGVQCSVASSSTKVRMSSLRCTMSPITFTLPALPRRCASGSS